MPDTTIVYLDGKPLTVPSAATDAQISAATGAIPAENAAQVPNAKTWSRRAPSDENAAPEPTRTPTTGHDFKLLGVNIHVPAEEKPRLDSNIAGWGDQGVGVAPEDALIAGQAVRGIANAASGSALAGVKAAISHTSPFVKYEATKALLTHMGVPSSLATVVGVMVSGYKQGAASAEAAGTGGLSAAEEAGLAKQGYSSETIAKIRAQTAAQTATPTVTKPVAAPQAVEPAAAATPAPKMALSATDVTKIKDLIGKGIPQGEAVRQVWNLKVREELAGQLMNSPSFQALK